MRRNEKEIKASRVGCAHHLGFAAFLVGIAHYNLNQNFRYLQRKVQRDIQMSLCTYNSR
jgi:hypothetical protein